MTITNEKINKKERKFYSSNLKADSVELVTKELELLNEVTINSKQDLETFIHKVSEFVFIIYETYAWKYIKMTCNADKPENAKAFNDFFANIMTKLQAYSFKFNKKIYESAYKSELPTEEYAHLMKIVANEIELFREENIPLNVKENELANKYGEMFSKLTVNFDGEDKTLIQMRQYQKSNDRKVREKAWRLVAERIMKESDEFNELFDELKKLRIQIAKNVGFKNYRDYMHQEKGRFDYTPQDIIEFHKSVEQVVVPFLKELSEDRKEKLKVNSLKPWDVSVDLDGKILKPFSSENEFVDKAVKILSKVKPEFGKNLNMMKNSGFLDLENRKGKAPGGYNFPLAEYGAAFIFMNAIGLQSDVSTLLHESGHAMHSFATADMKIAQYGNTPSEIAELASMSMELLTLDYLDEYYDNKEDLIKAKKEQLEGTLKFLPWCMIVDAFQQWIYTEPNHTAAERTQYFKSLMDRFNVGIDWSGLLSEKGSQWLRQLHIFEVPFYYIEYGISQLGAIAVYKNYKENGKVAIKQYEDFLKLGYSKSVKELYKAAGIKFDFSVDYIKGIVEFIKEELALLK